MKDENSTQKDYLNDIKAYIKSVQHIYILFFLLVLIIAVLYTIVVKNLPKNYTTFSSGILGFLLYYFVKALANKKPYHESYYNFYQDNDNIVFQRERELVTKKIDIIEKPKRISFNEIVSFDVEVSANYFKLGFIQNIICVTKYKIKTINEQLEYSDARTSYSCPCPYQHIINLILLSKKIPHFTVNFDGNAIEVKQDIYSYIKTGHKFITAKNVIKRILFIVIVTIFSFFVVIGSFILYKLFIY